MLKFESQTYTVVDYGDLERYIKEVYGVEYEIVAGEELSNDTHKLYHVPYEGIQYEGDQENFNEWLNGKWNNYLLGTILDDLCHRCLIPSGQYLLKVS